MKVNDNSQMEPLNVEQRKAITRLEEALSHQFGDMELAATALRHRSYCHQFKEAESGQAPEDNQRLEFLGDAVLGVCISVMLYDAFPELKEGVLSRMRAGLVNEIRLADIARQIGVDEALLLGRGEETTGGRNKNSILADAVEAVVAAVYLDGGFEAASAVVSSLWGDLVARSHEDDLLRDFKTQLQEYTQHHQGTTPEYQLVQTSGPDHARIFEVAVMVDDQAVATGVGRSKKEAERLAAREALNHFRSLEKTDEAG